MAKNTVYFDPTRPINYPVTSRSNETSGNVFLSLVSGFLAAFFLYLITTNVVIAFVAAVLICYIVLGIRTIRPTHRVVVEFLGKYQKFGQPGFYWILSGFQKLYAVNITETLVDAQPQEIITKDSLNASVDAQVYFKVRADETSVKASQYNVNDYSNQIVNLARTTLRNIIGNMNLKEANSERGRINTALYEQLSQETKDWGIEIVRTELKEIAPPQTVQEAMNNVVIAENTKIAAQDFATATETKADGERRARIKMADGEKQYEIMVAEGKAKAIELVNVAAEQYFIGNAQVLKKLETVQASLEKNTKIVVPSGDNLVNVIGNLAGTTE